jgi:hypothetical protein
VYRLIAILLLITSLNGYGQSPMTVSLANTPGPVVPGGHITLLFDVKSPHPYPIRWAERYSCPKNGGCYPSDVR